MKVRKCSGCKHNGINGKADVSFVYLGMPVKISKLGELCHECAKIRWIEGFEQEAKKFIEAADGKPRVNWFGSYSQRFDYDWLKRFYAILESIGILSCRAEGNWEIVAFGPIGLNPKGGILSYLYFTQKADAVEFARLHYANTLYHWEIHHIDEVIPKEKI